MFKNWLYRGIVLLGILLLSGFTPSQQVRAFDEERVDEIVTELFPAGVIRIGIKAEFEPFSYPGPGGDQIGFDVDLAREIARRWFGSEDAVEFEFVDADEIIPRLQAGNIDLVVAATTHTWDRDLEDIDFSYVYFEDGQGILVRTDSDIKNITDLNGKSVVVIEETTAECERLEPKLAEIDVFVDCRDANDAERALEALNNNEEIEAFISDSIRLERVANRNSDAYKLVRNQFNEIYQFTDEPYAIGLRPEDALLQELLNATLQAMKEDGFYNALFLKWFEDRTPVDFQEIPGDISGLKHEYSKLELIDTRQRKIVIGVKCDTPPFGELTEGAREPVGFDVDLGRAIADHWNITPDFVCVTSANRIEKLLKNEIDLIMASMTKTWSRAELIAFSQTYFLDGQSLLVRAEDAPDIDGWEPLTGQRVAGLRGSTSLENIPDFVTAVPFEQVSEAIAALLAGEVTAFTSDSVILSAIAEENAPNLEVAGGLLSEEPYGIGLPKGDFHFINLVNCTLQELRVEGIYNDIYEDWFGPNAVPYPIIVFPGDRDCNFNTAVETLPETPDSKITEIQGEQPLRVGVRDDFPPFGENEAGFDIDIAREFAERWYGDPDQIELVTVTAQNRIQMLQNGEVDLVIAGMTHRTERDALIDFSQTYFLDGQSLLVRESSDIETISDLDGTVVAALEGSTSLDNFEAILQEQANLESEEIDANLLLPPYSTANQAVDALENGIVDVFTSDSTVLREFAKTNDALVVVGGLLSREPYGIGVPQYDAPFLNLVNITLQEMKRDGTYDALYCEWFADNYNPYEVELWPIAEDQDTYQSINIRRNDSTAVNNPCEDQLASQEAPESPEITTDNATLYEVQSGDTLTRIAEALYDDPSRWRDIYDDNRDIIGDDPSSLEVGQELRIRK